MKHALDFGSICAILDWHPCMLSFAKFQETIVPPMPYGIALCTEYACENEGKAVIKRCHLCGYGYGLHQVCIVGYGSNSTGKKYWIVLDSAFGKIRVERGHNAFGIGVSIMPNDEARAFCALAGEHWPLAITRPLPPTKKWETFPARVKREEHQKIVERSWSEGRPEDE